MTDGPFKNLNLSSRWKRFAKAVENDAVDIGERCALALDALVREILAGGTRALLAELRAYSLRDQLEIDPVLSIERVFDGHEKSSFTNTLEKQLALRLCDQMATDLAISQALELSVANRVDEVKIRMEDECIRAFEDGEIKDRQFNCIISRIHETLDSLSMKEVSEVLLDGNRNAYKHLVSKKQGLDEGPPL